MHTIVGMRYTVRMKIDSSSERQVNGTLVLNPDLPENVSMQGGKVKLLIVSGALQGREIVVHSDNFTIGSSDYNDLAIPQDHAISKRHCELFSDEFGFSIRDLGSTNGTYVQGIRVSSAHLIPGAEIQLGHTRIVFCPLRTNTDIPLSSNHNFGRMIGRSDAMRRIFHLAETYAPSDVTVMISGETGTGKEILAEEIHAHSSRSGKPYIVIDCAAISKKLIEGELFGWERGAFPGAETDRKGAFELADGGTVFLDEVGDLPLELQPKLLRVIEKREIRRLGSEKVKKIDVRIISASNRNLAQEVNEGRFREDLYYRLSVARMDIPPLRRHRDDIPLLVCHFLHELGGENAEEQCSDFDRTMDVLRRHEWPGNVRELRNLIELAFYDARRPVDLNAFLSLSFFRNNPAGKEQGDDILFDTDKPFKDAKNELIEKFEQAYLNDLLARNRQNVSKSAREAGIERAYLQRLIRKYGMRDL